MGESWARSQHDHMMDEVVRSFIMSSSSLSEWSTSYMTQTQFTVTQSQPRFCDYLSSLLGNEIYCILRIENGVRGGLRVGKGNLVGRMLPSGRLQAFHARILSLPDEAEWQNTTFCSSRWNHQYNPHVVKRGQWRIKSLAINSANGCNLFLFATLRSGLPLM